MMRENWYPSVFEALKGPLAPRFVTTQDSYDLISEAKGSASQTSATTFLRYAEISGSLIKIRRGLWLNTLALPSPDMAEAVQHLRKGAVVSLTTVLGDAGVLNNFTPRIYAILPRWTGYSPNVNVVEASGTEFHFHSMRQEILNAGDKRDRLSPVVPYPRASVEAAIVHWLYLSAQKGSHVDAPDSQCDLEHVDEDRLKRLATAAGEVAGMDLWGAVETWVEKCRQRERDDDEQMGWLPGG